MKSAAMGTLVIGSVFAAAVAGPAAGRESVPALQPVCVIDDHPIDRAISTDWQGGKVCFCSEKCLKEFLASTGKYAARANHQLLASGQARQVACPFTGKPLNSQIPTVRVAGADIGFCCRACQQTVTRADRQTRFDLIFGDAFRTGFAVQKR